MLWCLFVSSLFFLVNCECDKETGPSGSPECVQLSDYGNNNQWGTCLTDVYIRTKSNQQHQCKDRTATYCYYQCMLESYNIEYGPVYDDCACRGEETYNLTLPSYCYSPSGTNCDWYEDCLERQFKCSETNEDYGMKFATTFCKLYEKSYNKFSPKGQRWIDSVRKCLQVSLVPLLRVWQTFSCKDVKQKAFASHTPCYVTPDKEHPQISYCNLGYLDVFRIAMTIKASLYMSTIDSVKGFLQTRKECNTYSFRNQKFDDELRKVSIQVEIQESQRRRRRSTKESSRSMHDIYDAIVNRIADQLQWEEKGVIWLAEMDQYYVDFLSKNVSIDIFLANRKTFDLNAGNISNANMSETILEFQGAVKNGKLFATSNELTYNVLSAKGCLDVNCSITNFDVTAKYDDIDVYEHSSNKFYIIMGITCGAVFVILCLVAIMCVFRKKKKY